MKRNYIKIILDFLLALTFALLMDPRVLSGLPFHEIAGLVFGVAILTHIGLNFSWVKNTTKKIFDSKLPVKTRISYLLNILLLFSMSAIIVTGILISRVVFPSLALKGNHMMRGLHNLAANITLVLVGLHIGVHWQWIKGICKKIFKGKEGKWRKGIVVSVLISFIILFGGIQWYSSTVKTSTTDFKQFEQRNFPSDSGNSNVNFQGPPIKDFQKHADKFEHHGKKNPFLTILQYLVIFTIIIIPTYYLDRRYLGKRRKQKRLMLKENEV
ncbi:DUF4405 domain-containing protein [Bacillus sp. FJAT-49736]|uniref:DUF4405 domain-containing protein n=1 Tax=Bacillus sp. FJAT-49736 TaxID=2833582 RepID=UPI0020161B8B|nr:DUF4405 domain-containing protein [Bacillus sp. FJAT-49736]